MTATYAEHSHESFYRVLPLPTIVLLDASLCWTLVHSVRRTFVVDDLELLCPTAVSHTPQHGTALSHININYSRATQDASL